MNNVVFVPGQFLSTLSLRRATREGTSIKPIFGISIHALLAESDLRVVDGSKSSIEISIHALLAESDYLVRGQRPNWRISIHALLAESDLLII